MSASPDPTSTNVEVILAGLMEGEHRRIQSIITALVHRNNQLLGLTQKNVNAFYLRGRAFRIKNTSSAECPPLHSELLEEGQDMLHASDIAEEDYDRLHQILSLLYLPCQSLREVGETSPKCLKPFLGPVAGQYAGDNTGFTLRHDERHWRQFQALLPKIEMLAVTSMIY